MGYAVAGSTTFIDIFCLLSMSRFCIIPWQVSYKKHRPDYVLWIEQFFYNSGKFLLEPYTKGFGRITHFLGNDLATVLYTAFYLELLSSNSFEYKCTKNIGSYNTKREKSQYPFVSTSFFSLNIIQVLDFFSCMNNMYVSSKGNGRIIKTDAFYLQSIASGLSITSVEIDCPSASHSLVSGLP